MTSGWIIRHINGQKHCFDAVERCCESDFLKMNKYILCALGCLNLTGGCHFSNLRHICGGSFLALQCPGISGVRVIIASSPFSPLPPAFASLLFTISSQATKSQPRGYSKNILKISQNFVMFLHFLQIISQNFASNILLKKECIKF